MNDEHGHDAGDGVLIEAARRFRHVLRGADTLARQGGDEFVVLCEEVRTVPEALAAADRLVHCLDEPISLSGGSTVDIGVSIGVAFAPDQSRDAERLIRDADTAMYQAKEAGRGQVAFPEPGPVSEPIA